MATTLKFFDPADGAIEVLPAASGGLNTIGFFGPGFGLSVRVGDFNEGTYRTTEDGQTNGTPLPNNRWANTSGSFVAGEIAARPLLEVLNTEATLRVELMTDSAIATQNTTFRTFDKTSIDDAPSGVDVYAAEIRTAVGPVGSGDTFWTPNLGGSGVILTLDDQGDAATTHNWWLALSASPTSIGEKTNFAFYFETEFL